jgi:hypothetical protein
VKPATLHITARQATDFALARGGISQPFHDPLAAVHAMVAIQAQYAASIPFAIHARCPSVPRTWTDCALAHDRSLVKTWCLRGTLHVLAADDLALMVGSFGERYHLAIERVMLRMCDMDTTAWYRVEQDPLHALTAGPLDRTALHAAVPRLRDVPWSGWGEDVKGLAYQGDLLMVGSKGSRPMFARRDTWLPDLRFRPRTRIKSLEELLVRYLRTFAPATLTDFVHWTGLPIATVRETVVRATRLVVSVAVEGRNLPPAGAGRRHRRSLEVPARRCRGHAPAQVRRPAPCLEGSVSRTGRRRPWRRVPPGRSDRGCHSSARTRDGNLACEADAKQHAHHSHARPARRRRCPATGRGRVRVSGRLDRSAQHNSDLAGLT